MNDTYAAGKTPWQPQQRGGEPTRIGREALILRGTMPRRLLHGCSPVSHWMVRTIGNRSEGSCRDVSCGNRDFHSSIRALSPSWDSKGVRLPHLATSMKAQWHNELASLPKAGLHSPASTWRLSSLTLPSFASPSPGGGSSGWPPPRRPRSPAWPPLGVGLSRSSSGGRSGGVALANPLRMCATGFASADWRVESHVEGRYQLVDSDGLLPRRGPRNKLCHRPWLCFGSASEVGLTPRHRPGGRGGVAVR